MQHILYVGRVALSPAARLIFIQPELTDMTLSPPHTAITFIGGWFLPDTAPARKMAA